MRYPFQLVTAISFLVCSGIQSVVGQTLSSNTVKYKLIYNTATEVYTVWVHPDYSTPNANNTSSNEFSATAQVSLKVPKAFVIQNITDLKGSWEKDPRKLGDHASDPGLANETYDSTARYYAIGKAPSETNLGKFTPGDSVALFTFRGNGCFGPVSILQPNDPFVQAAFNASSLNVRGSFYSRSGQPSGGNVLPLEQYIARKGPDAFCTTTGQVGIAKRVVSIVNNNNGSYDVAFRLKVVNSGGMTLSNVQVFDSLSNAFPAPTTFTLLGGVSTTPTLPVNASFTGTGTNTGLLAGTSSLAVGDSIVVDFTVRVVTPSGNFQNVAWSQGAVNGIMVMDRSTDGTSIDPDFNGNPGNDNIPTPIVINRTGDLALFTTVNTKMPQVNDNVIFKVVLKNQGQVIATGVEVKGTLPVGLDLVTTSGDGSYANGVWTVGTIALGDSAELFLTVKVISMGVQYFTAEVSKMNETDVDSSPNNGVESEDDFGRSCVSTPITLCASQAIEIAVPAGFTNIQWFKNNVPLANQNGSKLTVISAGSYTFTSSNSTCPTTGCCPILVEEVDCCPVQVCVPVLITRVKKGGTIQP